MEWIFQQKCLHKKLTGHDGWNQSEYAVPEETPCRFQAKQKLVRDKHGNEVMSQAEVWLPVDTEVKPDDMLVFPVEPTSARREYMVLNTGSAVGLFGEAEYLKAWC